VFIDGVLPLGNQLTLKAGFRADWASSNVDDLPVLFPNEDPYTQTLGANQFGRTFNLWTAYLNGEFKLTDHWTATAGFANAERPPTLTELYADRPLLAVIQNGLNFTQGNPFLTPDQARQLDLGVRAEYETLRFGLNGFYSWIHNYITFEEISPPTPPFQANGVQFINTNRASLSGFETYGEWDVFSWLTPFVVMEYVEGRDYSRDDRPTVQLPPGATPGAQEPLPGIPPLDTRVGLRVHEGRKNPRWGTEIVARMVAAQNRIAQSLGEKATPGFTVYTFRSYGQVCPNCLLPAGVENLGNRLYREHLDLLTGHGVFQPGVNFYFGAQVTY
jgi:outer membrane receptor protein involved in Fe transport